MAVVMKSDEAKAAILRGEAPDGLTVEGYLSFGPIQFPAPKPYTTFTHLPDNLTVGRLEISRCANFRAWPKGLHCKTLIVTDCPVANLPDDIVVEDSLHLQSCDNITNLPAISLRELALQTMAGISRLPVGLRVTETLNVSRCPKLVSLPAGLRLKSLIIAQCEWLYQLPFDFETRKTYPAFLARARIAACGHPCESTHPLWLRWAYPIASGSSGDQAICPERLHAT